MTDDVELFGALVERERAARGWSRSRLAREIGVSHATPAAWLAGRRPRPEHVAAAAVALGADLDDLLARAGYEGGRDQLHDYMVRTRRAFPDLYPREQFPDDMDVYAAFAAYLARERRARGITLGQLARALDVETITVRRWEAGVHPLPGHALAVAAVFGHDAAMVLGLAGFAVEQYAVLRRAAGGRLRSRRDPLRPVEGDEHALAVLVREGRRDAAALLVDRFRDTLAGVDPDAVIYAACARAVLDWHHPLAAAVAWAVEDARADRPKPVDLAGRADLAVDYWRRQDSATIRQAALRYGAPYDMVWRRARSLSRR